MRTALANAKAQGREPPVASFDGFLSSVLSAVVYGSLALVWSAFEAYTSSVFGRSGGFSTVRCRTPTYQARCHRDHAPAHILTILKDVRDRELHALPSYNTLACNLPPDEIMLQPVLVREMTGRREVLLLGGLIITEQRSWRDSLPISRSTSSESLGELLVDEAVKCVLAFDAAAGPTGALLRGPCRGPAQPLTFLQPPSTWSGS